MVFSLDLGAFSYLWRTFGEHERKLKNTSEVENVTAHCNSCEPASPHKRERCAFDKVSSIMRILKPMTWLPNDISLSPKTGSLKEQETFRDRLLQQQGFELATGRGNRSGKVLQSEFVFANVGKVKVFALSKASVFFTMNSLNVRESSPRQKIWSQRSEAKIH